ncbi:MAG: helix-turn-helix domain-containing protein [Synechococcales bacterium]|nr:helix-turn-helix domain-containing protein [Synechococcales bacterium]
MTHTITEKCTQCGVCSPICPTGAITNLDDGLWIDPTLCNDCRGFAPEPQCVSICPTATPPILLQAKKGRFKEEAKPLTSPHLFPNAKTNPFASAIVIWEACNVLAQRQSLPWQADEAGDLCHRRQVSGGRGEITVCLATTNPLNPRISLAATEAQAEIAQWDLRSACLHLLYAAYATGLERPWEESFTLNDQEISEYLGLDKRKDLSKIEKLTLIRDLVEKPCQLLVSVDWVPHGRFKKIILPKSRLWHLLDTQLQVQTDETGCKHLTGLTFTIQPGQWTKSFLNRQGARERSAFYQYGTLPKSLLHHIMSIWQQHEGAARIMLWLLFKSRMGTEQRITIPTLMRIAYGETRLVKASFEREERKRLLRSFESDLEVLNRYYLKPVFDPETYPTEIQPLWVKLADLPDDAEEALEFWIMDGSQASRLTDAAPRDKWQRLMHARLLRFDLPADWVQNPTKLTKKKAKHTKSPTQKHPLSGAQIATARKNLQLSQRTLADKLGKSQSWVRDIENGRLQVSEKDRGRLFEVLGIAMMG